MCFKSFLSLMCLPYTCIIITVILAQNAINGLQRHTSSLISQTTRALQLPYIFSEGISVKPHHYDTKTVLGMYTGCRDVCFYTVSQYASVLRFACALSDLISKKQF